MINKEEEGTEQDIRLWDVLCKKCGSGECEDCRVLMKGEECKHEFRFLTEFRTGTAATHGGILYQFHCVHCLAIKENFQRTYGRGIK